MARTPPRACRRFALAVALIASLSLVLFPAAAATGKNPAAPADPAAKAGANGNGHGNGGGRGNAGGNGNGNGRGHGGPRGGGSGGPSADSVQTAPTQTLPRETDSGGNGRGNGNGRGRGRGGDAPSSSGSATTPPTSGSAPRTEAPAAGGNDSSGAGSGVSPAAPGNGSQPSSGSSRGRNGGDGRRGADRSGRRDGRAGGAGPSAGGPERERATSREGVATASPTPLTTGESATEGDRERGSADQRPERREERPTVVRTFERVVQVIPTFIKVALAVLSFLLLIAAVAWFFVARSARFLRRQREALLGEIGTLQGALLPNVPPELSRLHASVAYRPAEGLAAGGDFYDAFPLDDGRVGIVVGDVAGHGKEALMHTALLRYTMRAYLEADLQPRTALQVAGKSLDRGFDTLATVILAVYDPRRHVLQYASAGHPPPVFVGEADHVPVTQASSPPIGAALPTGLRQTTVALPAGSAVCFFTDGLIEARRDGELIGRLGLVDIIRRLGPEATAAQVLDRVGREADQVTDDMAACMFRVFDGPPVEHYPRVEEIEVQEGEPLEETLGRFLAACGIEDERIEDAIASARRTVRQFGGAVVSASFPRRLANDPPRVDVKPANLETFAWARARRAAAV